MKSSLSSDVKQRGCQPARRAIKRNQHPVLYCLKTKNARGFDPLSANKSHSACPTPLIDGFKMFWTINSVLASGTRIER
jgi:hypothetical protein